MCGHFERFGIKLLENIIKDFKPLLCTDERTLLRILSTDFPDVFDKYELQLINKLQAFKLEVLPEDLNARLKFVKDVIKCLVGSAEELCKCIYKVVKELSTYRCKELLKG